MTDARHILNMDEVNVQYGSTSVIQVKRLMVNNGDVVIVKGPNGSGKSSLLNGIAGLGPDLYGRVDFLGSPLCKHPAHIRAKLGVRLLPQGRRIFPRLTPSEHIRLGTLVLNGGGCDGDHHKMILSSIPHRDSSGVSGGEAKAILLSALASSKSSLFMFDEPFAGLDHNFIDLVVSTMKYISGMSGAMIIVDHTEISEIAFPDATFANVIYANSNYLLDLNVQGIKKGKES